MYTSIYKYVKYFNMVQVKNLNTLLTQQTTLKTCWQKPEKNP